MIPFQPVVMSSVMTPLRSCSCASDPDDEVSSEATLCGVSCIMICVSIEGCADSVPPDVDRMYIVSRMHWR